jgi:hypothetical protein
MENKFYIDIPFKLTDQAKSLGALYDAGSRSWYVKTQEALETFDKVYLFIYILYKDKDKDKDIVKEMEVQPLLYRQARNPMRPDAKK